MGDDTARVVYGEPDHVYRAAPGASQSALKHILDCPARYQFERTHRVEKTEFDFGTAVHDDALGVGPEIVVLDFDDRRTKAYKDAAAEARAAGAVPLLRKVADDVKACADAVRAHPIAGPLLTREGESEVSIYWTDTETGMKCKGRIDRVTVTPDGTHWLPDLKTVGQSADPARFGRKAADLLYHLQAAFYLDGYSAASGVDFDDLAWLNVLAETNPPHLVSVVSFDHEAIAAGRALYRRALRTLAECRDTGNWPGYTQNEAAIVSLPYYALMEAEE